MYTKISFIEHQNMVRM